MAFAAGVSGIYVTQSQASGGLATGFYIFLSLVTLVAAVVSIALGEGRGESTSHMARMTQTWHTRHTHGKHGKHACLPTYGRE